MNNNKFCYHDLGSWYEQNIEKLNQLLLLFIFFYFFIIMMNNARFPFLLTNFVSIISECLVAVNNNNNKKSNNII